MLRLGVGRFPGQCNLYGGRAPRYECCELSFADSEKGLVDLIAQSQSEYILENEVKGMPYVSWVHFALDDIQNGDVTCCLAWCC